MEGVVGLFAGSLLRQVNGNQLTGVFVRKSRGGLSYQGQDLSTRSPTMQSFPHFGRVYAAYGGVFIVLSLLWGWGIDRKTPDLYDGIGAAICLVGISVILWSPRN